MLDLNNASATNMVSISLPSYARLDNLAILPSLSFNKSEHVHVLDTVEAPFILLDCGQLQELPLGLPYETSKCCPMVVAIAAVA